MGREGWLRKKKLTECLLLATPLHCLIDLGWVNAKSASCKTLCKRYLIECVAMLESYLYFMLMNFLLVLFYSKHFKNTTTNRGYNWGGEGDTTIPLQMLLRSLFSLCTRERVSGQHLGYNA